MKSETTNHTNKSKRITYAGAASLLILLSLSAILIWHWHNKIPSGHDAYAHLSATMRLSNEVGNHQQSFWSNLFGHSARYMPATYVLGSSFSLLFGQSYLPYALTILLFWLIALVTLPILGWKLSSGKLLGLLPLILFLTIPESWNVGISYNLEAGLLAGAFFILAMFVFADRFQGWFPVAFATLLIVIFSTTKTILFASTIPAGIVFCFIGDAETRKKRLLFFVAILLIAATWFALHYRQVFPEFMADFSSISGEEVFGLSYYLRLLAIHYKGLPFFIGFAIAIATLGVKRKWNPLDLAIGLYALCPLFIFLTIDTKRAWYPLVPVVVLSIWFVHISSRLWDLKRIRQLTTILIGFYLLCTCLTIFSVFTNPSSNHPEQFSVAGIRKPFAPTKVEKELVRVVLTDLEQRPRMKFSVDLSNSKLRFYRIGILTLLAKPQMADVEQVAFLDNTIPLNGFFVEWLPNSALFYTLGQGWPKLDFKTQDNYGDEKSIKALIKTVDALQSQFTIDRTISLAGQTALTVFRNKHFTATQVEHAAFEKHTSKEVEDARIIGIEALNHGDYKVSSGHLSKVVNAKPNDYNAVLFLAKSLIMQGDFSQAKQHMDHLFSAQTTFGTKIEALTELARLEASGHLQTGAMDQYLTPLLLKHSADSNLMYSLLSAKIHAMQIQQDWEGVLNTIKELRRHLTTEQVAGVNLQEAIVLINLRRSQEAESLLKSNLQETSPDQQVFSESALHYAKIQAENGDLTNAMQSLQLATQGKFDPNTYANAVIHVSRTITQSSEAEKVLEQGAHHVSGAALGNIQIEIGKLAMANGNTNKALAAFSNALANSTETATIDWLKETIDEIEKK